MAENESVQLREAEAIAAELDADVLLYNGPLEPGCDDHVLTVCQRRRRRKNAVLLLVTTGGDANTAYRIARCLQRGYEKLTIIIPSACKSAGTLLALGAHELVIFDHGELGPLDVQMSKKDELFEMQSGLTVNTSLAALQQKAYLAFEEFFLQTETRSSARIRLTTAADIAVKLTTGLFAPIYSQIDPLHVGEAARAIQIAEAYGTRLIAHSKNATPDALHLLITHYPDHGFVIDREEAKSLFTNVREPNPSEEALVARLGIHARRPDGEKTTTDYLSREVAPAGDGEHAEPSGQHEAAQPTPEPGAGSQASPPGTVAKSNGEGGGGETSFHLPPLARR